MAVLTSPVFDFGGALAPQAQSELVPLAQNAPPAVIVYTGDILVSPSASQFAPDPPVPDSGAFVWQRQVVDASGNIVTDARVEVRHAETNSVAVIYSDREATTTKANPFLVDSEGFARFYALAGLYTITASRAGLERIFENVLLGVRVEDVPDLSDVVGPLVDAALADDLAELDAAVAALPQLVRFRVLAAGTGQGLPDGYSCQRVGVGYYRVTHPIGTVNYHPKLTVWDPSSDRLYGAMMYSKQTTNFEYRVRSIHDEAANSDADVDVEITV